MKQNRRRNLYVQKQIQRKLATRCVFYWCCCLASVFLLLVIAQMFTDRSASTLELVMAVWREYYAAVMVSFILLPLVVWDMIKFSHRIVGPIIRLEREMQRLGDGNSVKPLQFRKNDFWHGLSNEFNVLRKQFFQLKHRASIAQERKRKKIGEPVVVNRYPV